MEVSGRPIYVVGGGLAGSECALQLADLGRQVVLVEMRRGVHTTPAHKTQDFAELVCSNSFGSMNEISAPGQLKWEARVLGSQVLESAIEARVPAGQALGIDRLKFSAAVQKRLMSHPNIRIEAKLIESLDQIPRPAVIATGPLTDQSLAKSMMEHFGDEFLYFFDAIAPIIATESINTHYAWKADRWDKGTGDYFNCPLNKDQYIKLIEAIIAAKKVEPKEFEKTPYFESCLPVEVLAGRGVETLRFGPMSPKGLRSPSTHQRPYAVVQLRQDNVEGTAYNMVGFQTKMAYGDQKEVFRMIPGLENAEFLKLGSIHRNLYINSPKRLSTDLSSRKDPWLFFAGQITGVEGYFESTCVGLMVAHFLHQKLQTGAVVAPPRLSAFGSILNAITLEVKDNFQPTNINFSLFPSIPEIRDSRQRKEMQIQRARESILAWGRANSALKVDMAQGFKSTPMGELGFQTDLI
jgi:methylenetetrahydrofolate--tRNA-(uracil-5-)-methyltransferase